MGICICICSLVHVSLTLSPECCSLASSSVPSVWPFSWLCFFLWHSFRSWPMQTAPLPHSPESEGTHVKNISKRVEIHVFVHLSSLGISPRG